MRAIRRVRRSLTVTTSTSIGSPFAAPVCLWVLVSLQPPRVFIQKIAAVTRARSSLTQGRLRDAEHARNVRFGDDVGGHRLGLPPLHVIGGPDRSSHWKIRPLRSATI